MNMGDYDGRTALHISCAENHLACIKFLIQTCKVDIEVQDRWGNTAMQASMIYYYDNIPTDGLNCITVEGSNAG